MTKAKPKNQEHDEGANWVHWLLRSAVGMGIVKGAMLGGGLSGNAGGDNPATQGAVSSIGIFVVLLGAISCLVLPILAIRSLPGFFGFLRGSEKYRRRWLRLQFNAWALTIGFSILAYGIVQGVFQRSSLDSLGFMFVGAIVAGIGFYLGVMSRMPKEFYLEDVMGQKVMKFLGCNKVESVPAYCLVSAVLLLAISAFIFSTPIVVFRTP